MVLSELLTRLARGELKNLSMAVNGAIIEASIPTVIDYINEGLLRLHSRFVLREDDVLIEMYEGIATYELKPQYAMSYEGDIEVPRKYIMDIGPKKFVDDVIRITGAFDSFGQELELNNAMSAGSMFTPRPKEIQIPLPLPGQSLSVTYQARHPVLVAANMDDEIQIPDILLGALTGYVAYMAYDFLGGAENMGRASAFMNRYEKICMEMEEKDGMGTQTRAHSDVFEMRGWI